ncbi:MAG: ArnT family glycosyltransferase [Phycisphaerae bacterium]
MQDKRCDAQSKSLAIGGIITALALLLRIGWIAINWSRTGATLAYPDEQLHWEIASRLVNEGVMATADGRFVARMPLYPLYLALFAPLGDIGVLAARVGQALLGAATAWLGFRWALTALGPAAAIVAGALIAIEPYSIFFSALLLTEVPYTFVGFLFAYAAWRIANAPELASKQLGLLVGLSGAAAILLRPSAALLVPATWLLLFALDPLRRRGGLRMGMYGLILLTLMLPWGLRNRAVVGDFAWLSANGGLTLYDGQGPQARGDSDQSFLQSMPELAAMGEVQRDAHLRDLAIAHMRRDPGRVLELAWAKFLRTWSLAPNVAEHRSGMTAIVSAAFTGAVLLGSAIALLRLCIAAGESRARLLRFHAMIWLPVVYYTLLHCVYVGSLRYRVPVMPMVELAAAAAVVGKYRVASSK